MGGINDPELEKRKTVEEIKELIIQRMRIYKKETRDIKHHFDEKEDKKIKKAKKVIKKVVKKVKK